MNVDIPDFVGSADPLTVRVSPAGEFAPATVSLSRHVGGFSFGYHLLPDQARKLACALLDMADQLQPEETAA